MLVSPAKVAAPSAAPLKQRSGRLTTTTHVVPVEKPAVIASAGSCVHRAIHGWLTTNDMPNGEPAPPSTWRWHRDRADEPGAGRRRVGSARRCGELHAL